ncbi:MAG: hypothetical protein CFE44_18900, partial [Burkholderiales bacterium PBB4]
MRLMRMWRTLAWAWVLVLTVRTRLIIRELAVATTLPLFTATLAAAFLLPALALRLMLLWMALRWMLALRTWFALLGSLLLLRLAWWTLGPAMLDATASGNT